MKQPPDTVIAVGDTVDVPTLGVTAQVERVSIATHPHLDPAAETYSVEVPACEIGVPCVFSLSGGRWAYGYQCLKQADGLATA